MKKLFFMLFIVSVTGVTSYFASCTSGNKNDGNGNAATVDDSVKLLLQRGEYLATRVTVCIDCHSKRDTTKFSMPVIPGTEGGGAGFAFGKGVGIPGEVTAPNITAFALKDWTDEEIIRAITEGINKKGDTLVPIMPYHSYSSLYRQDALAIVAYIRSLKPIENTVASRNMQVPMSVFGPLVPCDINKNNRPDTTNKVKYGAYLTILAACSDCHTPRGPEGPDFSKPYAGGTVFTMPGFKVVTANITPDEETGIGSWTEDHFVDMFKENASDEIVNKNPGRLNTIMPWSMYGKMKDADLRSIYAFLKTLKPVNNAVEKYLK